MKTAKTLEDQQLILTRDFDVPPSLLFEIWSDCKHLKRWWGPKEWPMDECEMDFREGGQWRYCLRGPNEGGLFDKISFTLYEFSGSYSNDLLHI